MSSCYFGALRTSAAIVFVAMMALVSCGGAVGPTGTPSPQSTKPLHSPSATVNGFPHDLFSSSAEAITAKGTGWETTSTAQWKELATYTVPGGGEVDPIAVLGNDLVVSPAISTCPKDGNGEITLLALPSLDDARCIAEPPGTIGLTPIGQSVWALASGKNDTLGTVTANELYQLSAGATSFVYVMKISADTSTEGGIAGAPDGDLWITSASNNALFKVNPRTATVATRVTVASVVTLSLTASTVANDSTLWVVQETKSQVDQGAGGATITARSAVTGAVLHQLTSEFGVTAPEPFASSGGVWLTFRSGMAGSWDFLSLSPWKLIEGPSLWDGAVEHQTDMGGDQVTVGSNVAWVYQSDRLGCTSGATGRLLAEITPFSYQINDIAVSPTGLAVGKGNVVYLGVTNDASQTAESAVVALSVPTICDSSS